MFFIPDMSIHKTAFLNNNFAPIDQITISPFDRGFMFGDAVYEVIRCYYGNFFMLNEHINRLSYSLSQLKIRFFDFDMLKKNLQSIIELNHLENSDVTVYVQITRGVYERMLNFPPDDVLPTIFMYAKDVVNDKDVLVNGINTYTFPDIRWSRCDIKSTILLANVMTQQNALEKGGKMGIFIRNGQITEGTHTSVFAVKNSCILTHPAGNNILPSITRSVVLKLCNIININVIESAVKIDEIQNLDELFVAGTTPEITPVVYVDDICIGTGKPGKITLQLHKAFKDLINT
ncbi:MAG: aminotransferase class IV [Bacteroidota bacterium]